MIELLRIHVIWIVVALMTLTAATHEAWAGFVDITAIGFRSGISTGTDTGEFEQYELFLHYPTNWDEIRISSNWYLLTTVSLSGGILRASDEVEGIVSIGPRLVLGRVDSRISLDGGIVVTFLGEENFTDTDFGGPIQFTSHVGINLPLGKHLSFGYRLQHMSNAGLRRPNPGLNMHLFGVSLSF